jgi:hypothetical protein
MASFCSTWIIALGAYTTLSYVQDRSLLIAACVGAFVGTLAATTWALREPEPPSLQKQIDDLRRILQTYNASND